MRSLAIWLRLRFNISRPIWIGMYSTRSVRRKRWRWVDMAAMHYTNWKATEPNDAGRKEDCVTMEYVSGTLQWADENCSLQFNYLCKISH
ncbi:C-type lection lectoxin-Enh3-like [Candoia aspera]|uniref:C-type lection lectoxin-Enh3-like n=1 Tax=Candoia aspera TaxID=51853 RepID=UPI002FD7AFC8